LYRQALARQPDDKAQILANLGDLYRKQQRYDEGRRALARAIDLEGDQAEWRFRLGRLERAAGRGEAATAGFTGAIALDSTHVAARTHRAEMAAAMGAYARAIADFGVAVAVNPASSRAWFGLGRVLDDTGEWHRAAQAYRQFLSHWPQDDARARHARERLRANEERH
jgi:tetratricopeptide (TPR) repeat protein